MDQKKEEERDPRCVKAKCILDGRNCDPDKCSFLNKEQIEPGREVDELSFPCFHAR